VKRYVKAILGGFLAILAAFGWTFDRRNLGSRSAQVFLVLVDLDAPDFLRRVLFGVSLRLFKKFKLTHYPRIQGRERFCPRSWRKIAITLIEGARVAGMGQ